MRGEYSQESLQNERLDGINLTHYLMNFIIKKIEYFRIIYKPYARVPGGQGIWKTLATDHYEKTITENIYLTLIIYCFIFFCYLVLS